MSAKKKAKEKKERENCILVRDNKPEVYIGTGFVHKCHVAMPSFDAIRKGVKSFVVLTNNDRMVQKGDYLAIWGLKDGDEFNAIRTNESLVCEVKYVQTGKGIVHGYAVCGIVLHDDYEFVEGDINLNPDGDKIVLNTQKDG